MWFGNLETMGDFFVGEKAPFDMLLGRPWQRINRVSVDEHENGTYLVFKDENWRETYEKSTRGMY